MIENCVGYCVACDKPISAEGSLICSDCQNRVPPDEDEHLLTIKKAKKSCCRDEAKAKIECTVHSKYGIR